MSLCLCGTSKTPAQSASSAVRSQGGRNLYRMAGMTLLELLVACSILVILSTVAMPLARVTVRRHKENELRDYLREMRIAIDRYKDDADQNKIQVQSSTNTEHYPPDLQTLVSGVPLTGAQDKRVHYLREIHADPLTGDTDWGLRSVEDDQDTTSWGGQDVFDVYSKATGTALDGTKYSDW
jgi:general secretion pathway protein G